MVWENKFEKKKESHIYEMSGNACVRTGTQGTTLKKNPVSVKMAF